jgi:hypothetical protein
VAIGFAVDGTIVVFRLLTCPVPAAMKGDGVIDGLLNPPILKFGISSTFCSKQIAIFTAKCCDPEDLVSGIIGVGSAVSEFDKGRDIEGEKIGAELSVG